MRYAKPRRPSNSSFTRRSIMSRYIIAVSIVAILSLVYVFARAETESTREEREHAAGKGYTAPESLRIAIVDIAALYKTNPRLQANMKELKKKVEAAEVDLKEQGEKIAKLKQELSFTVDPTVQKSANKAVTDATDLFNTQRSTQGAQFMHQEGELYFDVMQDINREITRVAARHNIDLVLKINRDPIDKNDSNDILRAI